MPTPGVDPNGVFYPDGSPVPAGQIAQAISSGQARWRKDAEVHFVDEKGDLYQGKGEHAWDAIQRGWQPVSSEEAGFIKARREAGLGEQLKGALVGAGETLTGGVSALAFPEASRRARAVTPEALEAGSAAALVAPYGAEGLAARGLESRLGRTLTGVSEAATALPTTVSRFAGGVGRGVEALLPEAASFAKPLVRGAMTGGLEAGTFGAQQELARQAAGGERIDAERILSAGGEGFLFGAGVGGVGEAAVGAATAAKSGFREALRSTKEPGELSTVESLKAQALGIEKSKLSAERARLVIDEASRNGTLPEGVWDAAKKSMSGKAADIAKAREAFGQEIADQYRVGDAALAKRAIKPPTWEEFLKRNKVTDEVIDAVPHQRGFFEEAWRNEVDLAKAASKLDKTAILADSTEQIAGLRAREGEYVSVARRLQKWEDSVRAADTFEAIHKVDSDLYRQIRDKNTPSVLQGELLKFRQNLKKGIVEELKKVAPEAATRLKTVDELYGAFAEASKAADKTLKRKGGSIFTPFDIGMASMGVVSGSPAGLVYAGVHAGLRLAAKSPRVAAGTARFMDKLARTADEQAIKVTKASEKVAQGGISLRANVLPKLPVLLHNYSEKAAAAHEMVANPQAAAAKLADRIAPLAEHDPAAARWAVHTLTEDLKFLAGRTPKEMADKDLYDLLNHPKTAIVPQSQAASFLRAAKALASPYDAVISVTEGKMSPEAPEVLKARRPDVLEEADREFTKAVAKLAQDGKVAPYEFRVQASLLTGHPYDASMTKESVKFFQDVWSGRKAREAQQIPGAGGGGRGAQRSAYRGAHKNSTRFRTGAEDNMAGIENE